MELWPMKRVDPMQVAPVLPPARKGTPVPRTALVEVFHRNGIQVNGSFVLGFDHDRPDVFENLARWIEENRLECATFHILTPYPNTPLFRRMEAEGRLLHKDWTLYDTAHCVFRPRHMSPEELEAGYGWIYRRLFSLSSIWARRPRQASAVLPYLAMALLYKRSNFLWRFLIQHRLTHKVWAPLVNLTRLRHLRYRRRQSRRPLLLRFRLRCCLRHSPRLLWKLRMSGCSHSRSRVRSCPPPTGLS